MKPEAMKAYIREQLATIASQRNVAEQRLRQLQHELTGLQFAQQAYQDMLDEITKRELQPATSTEEPTP